MALLVATFIDNHITPITMIHISVNYAQDYQTPVNDVYSFDYNHDNELQERLGLKIAYEQALDLSDATRDIESVQYALDDSKWKNIHGIDGTTVKRLTK